MTDAQRAKLEQARADLVKRSEDLQQKITRMQAKGAAIAQSIKAIDADLAKPEAAPA